MHDNKFFSLTTVLLLWLTTIANSAEATITVGRPDFSQHITTLDYLIDQQDKLSLQDVERPEYHSAFRRWNTQQFNLPSNTTIWLRLTIHNITEQPTPLILRANYNDTPSPDIFISPSSRQNQLILSPLQGSLTSHQKELPITINAGMTSTIYLKLKSNYRPRINLYLESMENAISSNQVFLLLNGVLLGGNLLLMLFCISFARKRKTPDLYILTALSFIIFIFHMAWMGIPAKLWLITPVPRYSAEHSLMLFGYAALTYLAQKTLPKAAAETSFIDRAFPALIFIDTALAFFALTSPPYYSDGIHQAAVCFNAIVLTLGGIIRLYEGDDFANQWLAVIIPFTVLQLITSLTLIRVLPFNSQAMEALLLVAALGLVLSLTLFRIFRAADRQESEPVPSKQEIKSPDWSYLGHELRTPMNGILGMTELMSSTTLSNRQQDYMQTIQLSGHELLTLINQVVDISKITHGDLSLLSDTFETDDLLHNCIERYNYKASQLGLELACWTDMHAPPQLKGDTARISRILNTFMSHAINNTEFGEILLTADIHPSTEQDKRNDNEIIRFSIQTTDNGSGYQSGSHSLNSYTKLNDKPNGLSLSRQIIQYMGGMCGASRNGQGTVYWFNLPLIAIHATNPTPPTDSNIDLGNNRALVVDDNDTCRNILVQQIQKLGLRVEQARDATEALALLRTEAALKRPFDVIFLDHQMPGINGMQLARRITDDPTFDKLIVVMLTGLSQLPDQTLLTQTRINRVLTKPASGKRLKQVLEEELAEDVTPA